MQKQHAVLQEKAMLAQRSGDMRKFAELTSQAEQLYQQIQEIEKQN